MSAESEADLAAMFSEDDFGDTAIYTSDSGPLANPISGVFHRPTEIGFANSGARVVHRVTTFVCAEALLPADHKDGDGVVVKGLAYKARDFEPDGTGLVTMRLERA